VPMMSLDNSFSSDELTAWGDRLTRRLAEPVKKHHHTLCPRTRHEQQAAACQTLARHLELVLVELSRRDGGRRRGRGRRTLGSKAGPERSERDEEPATFDGHGARVYPAILFGPFVVHPGAATVLSDGSLP